MTKANLTTTTGESFIDVDCRQQAKFGQVCSGDVFLTRNLRAEGRIISVLSDGLGSGAKAGVLATLTATMAMKYTASFVDLRRGAATIMDTLPICAVRKISYATFTIVDLDTEGNCRIIEHGNPPFILMREGREIPVEKRTMALEHWKDRIISYANFRLALGDRIVYFSDGVSQSGLGRWGMPLGWERENVVIYLRDLVRREPDLSAQRLAERLTARSLENDGERAKDDISSGVVYFRKPRRLLVITGPPFSKSRDPELAELICTFSGRKAICGGTTATIVSEQLGRKVVMDLNQLDPMIPPASKMDGVDLITEGTLTLARVAELLQVGATPSRSPRNAADSLVKLMLESDIVEFVVGTRINEAHQDPNVPVELDLRRNIIRKIAELLESRYLKQPTVRFL
jgi:hypothetical protein